MPARQSAGAARTGRGRFHEKGGNDGGGVTRRRALFARRACGRFPARVGPGTAAAGDEAISGATIEEQAELTLSNVVQIVVAAGGSADDVAQVTVFLADIGDFDRFNAVYRRIFRSPMPARSCVQAVLDGILVEIDAIAYLGGASGGRGEAAE